MTKLLSADHADRPHPQFPSQPAPGYRSRHRGAAGQSQCGTEGQPRLGLFWTVECKQWRWRWWGDGGLLSQLHGSEMIASAGSRSSYLGGSGSRAAYISYASCVGQGEGILCSTRSSKLKQAAIFSLCGFLPYQLDSARERL